MPPNHPSQYDFIMNSSAKPPRQPIVGNSLGARVAVVAGGVILLIILVVIVNSLLSSGSKAQTQRLTDIVQAQNEIMRVSTLGANQSKNIDTRNLATNTQLTVASSQQQFKKTLSKHGVSSKALTKTIGATKNAKTDAALTEAKKNNRYDETFRTVLAKQLTDYQKLLKAAYNGSTASEKKLLDASFDNVATLTKKTTPIPGTVDPEDEDASAADTEAENEETTADDSDLLE